MVATVKYVGWVNRPGGLAERLIVGDEMLQSQRLTFPIDPLTSDRSNQITGTIGNLDFVTVATHEMIGKRTTWRGLSKKVPKTYTAIKLSVLGIEPDYQRRGYALQLLGELEGIARDRQIRVLVSMGPFGENPASLRFHESAKFLRLDRFFRTGETSKFGYYHYFKLL